MKKELGMILIASFLLVGCAESSEPQALEEIENDTVVIEEIVEVDEVAQVDEEVIEESKCPTTGFMEKAVNPSMQLGFDSNLVTGNHCSYDKGTGEPSPEFGYNSESCADTFDEEFNKHEYSIVNDCLYQGDESVFEKPISQMLRDDEFVNANSDRTMHVGYYAYEWARAETDESDFLYFASSSDCGGCNFIGSYFEIDKETGEISKGYFEMPYTAYISFSPNGEKFVGIATEVLPGEGEYDQQLFIYDLETQIVTPIDHELPVEGTFLSYGMPSVLDKSLVQWIDDDTLSLNPHKLVLDEEYYNQITEEFLYDEPVIIEL